MKRILCLLIACIILLSFAACTGQEDASVTFYYKAAETTGKFPTTLISSEGRSLSVSQNDYLTLLQRYFSGPQDPKNKSPFPAGTTIKRITFGKHRAYITLSDHMATLTGTDLSIACACLTRTVEELTGVESVELSLESSLINNEPYLILRYSNFAVSDAFAQHITQ